MGVCILVEELNRLRKSSADSIDSEKTFDSFKQYMHVRRNAEDDLKEVLRQVNSSNKKTLILVCGSAGDGKSHILSYLKNADEEHLLDGYKIHNDATESSAPTKTAIQTLSEVLDDFADNNLEAPGANMILAINLGVLNNFIESVYGERYSKLRGYVYEHYILSTKVVMDGYDFNSPFQHVSFSDYQMYSLTKDGVQSDYIEQMLDRVYGNYQDNPFIFAFNKGCCACPLRTKCPVHYNFLFLQDKVIQKYIADTLVKTIIEKKYILTTREMLNYFYDITVPQDFSYSGLSQATSSNNKTIRQFINGTVPSLMYNQTGISLLMDNLKSNDPVLYRSETSDDFAVEYYVSEDISESLKKLLKNTPYENFILEASYIEEINADKDLKSLMFSSLIRIQNMQQNTNADEVYDEFLRNLYFFNAGKKKKLGNLYNLVQNAILQWCGTDGDGHLCLTQNDQEYSLYQEIEFDQDLDCIPQETDEDKLDKFVPEIKVGFLNHDGKAIANLDIDFSLYLMIKRLNGGLYTYSGGSK